MFSSLNAYSSTADLTAAFELDLVAAIAEGADQAAALAKRAGVAERGARILADYLTIQGFLTKENDRYALAQETAVFLDRRSPAYMGSVIGFLPNDRHKQAFEHLTEAVRAGGRVMPETDNRNPQDAGWVAFAKSMAPLTGPSAAF